MEYSVAIRTLGTAGEKYQRLLESLERQTVPPKQIVVYIAEGYPLPEETIGKEQYVYVRKGMVAQRALRYDEIDTEYILFLDDEFGTFCFLREPLENVLGEALECSVLVSEIVFGNGFRDVLRGIKKK